MNGIRNTYLYVCGSQRLLDIRRIYTSAGLIGLSVQITDFNYLNKVMFLTVLYSHFCNQNVPEGNVFFFWN